MARRKDALTNPDGQNGGIRLDDRIARQLAQSTASLDVGGRLSARMISRLVISDRFASLGIAVTVTANVIALWSQLWWPMLAGLLNASCREGSLCAWSGYFSGTLLLGFNWYFALRYLRYRRTFRHNVLAP